MNWGVGCILSTWAVHLENKKKKKLIFRRLSEVREK